MEIDRAQVIKVLRERGDDDSARRAQDELPQRFDPDEHAQLLLSYGVDAQDLDEAPDDAADDASDTGLGSGLGSGLGHSHTSEPEPLLGDDRVG